MKLRAGFQVGLLAVSGVAGAQTLPTVPVYSYAVPAGGYAGNGNVVAQSDSVTGTWNYGYDGLNRLTAASVTGGYQENVVAYCWSYDSFGNRTVQSGSSAAFANGGTCQPAANASVTTTWANYTVNGADPGTNRIVQTGAGGTVAFPVYDAGGNVTNDGAHSYLYDGDGRVCAVAATGMSGGMVMLQYLYDAAGQRVGKGTITTWSCDVTTNGFSATNVYVLGPNGEQMTELAPNSSGIMTWQHTNVNAGGQIATYANDNLGLHFQITDPLGTKRVQASYTGAVQQTCPSLPFGDALPCVGATEHFFTGYERDAETGLDFAQARYYGSSLGRFMSPDPLGSWVADVADPQSWNFYAYSRNNPLINTDPSGYDCVYINDSGDGIESVDHNSDSGECGKNGGDWVNGTLSGATYFSDSGTFAFQSYDSDFDYLTYATAPGVQADGTTCDGNCDLVNGYTASPTSWLGSDEPLNPYAQAVLSQVGNQLGPLEQKAARAFCKTVTLGNSVGITAGVAGAPVPKSLITSVPRAGGAGVSKVTTLAGSIPLKGGGVISGEAGQFLKSISASAGSFAGTARIGGAIGRAANKIASSEISTAFALLSLACYTGHP